MKKILIITLLSVLSAGAGAVPAPLSANKASVTAKAKAQPLVGQWVATDGTPGKMTFTADGKITIAPDGFDALQGAYSVDGHFVDITTVRGKATLIYRVDKGALFVEYENGLVQNFTKQKPSIAGKAKKATAK